MSGLTVEDYEGRLSQTQLTIWYVRYCLAYECNSDNHQSDKRSNKQQSNVKGLRNHQFEFMIKSGKA